MNKLESGHAVDDKFRTNYKQLLENATIRSILTDLIQIFHDEIVLLIGPKFGDTEGAKRRKSLKKNVKNEIKANRILAEMKIVLKEVLENPNAPAEQTVDHDTDTDFEAAVKVFADTLNSSGESAEVVLDGIIEEAKTYGFILCEKNTAELIEELHHKISDDKEPEISHPEVDVLYGDIFRLNALLGSISNSIACNPSSIEDLLINRKNVVEKLLSIYAALLNGPNASHFGVYAYVLTHVLDLKEDGNLIDCREAMKKILALRVLSPKLRPQAKMSVDDMILDIEYLIEFHWDLP
jgi:hypothetical protein